LLQRSPDLAVGDRGPATFVTSPFVTSPIFVLQRSPDLAVGDRNALNEQLVQELSLQRSPDLAVGDRAGGADGDVEDACFNGAPTSRSGIDVRALLHEPRAPASTEPRPRGRGSSTGSIDTLPSASLQRSPDLAVGDRVAATPAQSPISGFNGAPTSRSGIEPDRAVHPGERRASTEPRPRGRGSPAGPPRWRGRVRASTEPRPRGRGSSRRRDLTRGPPYASTEPRPRGRGSRRGVDLARVGAHASTEPRPRGRGSQRVDAPGGGGHEASTEPRPRGRGSQEEGLEPLKLWWLQRSPDLAVGDRRPGFLAARNGGWLQRSPDLAVGDRAASISRSARGVELQRSPDLAVGDRWRRDAEVHGREGFNGAPTSRSGIVRSSATAPCFRTRFNGAPTSRSGIAACPASTWTYAASLQRSPDLAVGDRSSRCSRSSRSTCFNGAPTSRSGIGPAGPRRSPSWTRLQRSPDLAVGDR